MLSSHSDAGGHLLALVFIQIDQAQYWHNGFRIETFFNNDMGVHIFFEIPLLEIAQGGRLSSST
ncbi:MAG: hypothetical protein RQ899_11950 [Pseudomonadales bacterium]|nr:hypothetical protein [Pseudomonadales bacterium]